jgi:hypothetical protein
MQVGRPPCGIFSRRSAGTSSTGRNFEILHPSPNCSIKAIEGTHPIFPPFWPRWWSHRFDVASFYWDAGGKKKKGKVVPLRSIEAHLGERRYSSYSFLILALQGMSGQLHAPATLSPPGKEPPVPIVQEAGWAPEPVWTQRLEEKSCLCRGSHPGRPVRSQTLYWLSYPAHFFWDGSSQLSWLEWTTLFVLQRPTVSLWPWVVQFGDDCCNDGIARYGITIVFSSSVTSLLAVLHAPQPTGRYIISYVTTE